MLEQSTAADSPVLVAGDARGGVEDRSQTIAPGGQGIAGVHSWRKSSRPACDAWMSVFACPSYRSNQPVARYPKGATTVSSTIQHNPPQSRFVIGRFMMCLPRQGPRETLVPLKPVGRRDPDGIKFNAGGDRVDHRRSAERLAVTRASLLPN